MNVGFIGLGPIKLYEDLTRTPVRLPLRPKPPLSASPRPKPPLSASPSDRGD